jgi:peptide/nickel transport system permease protein
MIRYLGGRLASAVVVLVVLSIATFALQHLVHTDPAIAVAGEGATPEQLAKVREELGLNDSLPQQYLTWAGNALHGDLGTSWNVQPGKPVRTLIAERFTTTLALAMFAILLGVLIAVVLGTTAAVFEDRWPDRAVNAFSSIGLAMPNFWFGLLLVYVFALRLHWLPAIGHVALTDDPWEWLKRTILPATALALTASAQLIRQLRASLVQVLHAEFIRSAYAKGLRPTVVLMKHGLRNAAIPVVTLLGLQLIQLLGGAVIIEVLFVIPGLGTLLLSASTTQDIPIIQGVVLVFGVLALVVNLVVDASYGFLNPRVRAPHTAEAAGTAS